MNFLPQSYRVLYRLMRVSVYQILFALAFTSLTLGRDVRAQELLNRRITLQATNQPVKTVLNRLSRLANVRFTYSSALIRSERKVTLDANNQPLGEVLTELLKPLNIEYRVEADEVVLNRAPTGSATPPTLALDQTVSIAPAPQLITVQGRVTDSEKEEGLPGVSVVVKGTQRGTTTDATGNYSIAVPEANPTLIFSFIGYESQEIVVGNRTTLTVRLKTSSASLNEVVVVGYGTQKQKEVTGATSAVTAKDITAVAVTGLDQALQGKAAGVQVTQNSGEPGGSVSIRIRGVGSINSSNEPLYVVDGIPFSSLNSINPNDIERIDILKDAASAAIYGSRASNGVVLVTTKRAKSGKTTITFDAYAGVQNAAKKLNVLDGPQFARLANENLVNSKLVPNPAWSNPATVPSSDWQSAVLQSAPIQSYAVSIGGGSDKSRTLFSASYFEQGGIIIGSNYKRYTARLNTDYDLSSRFKVGITLNVSADVKKTVASQDGFAGVLLTATRLQPTQPITAPQDGYYSLNPDGSVNPAGKDLFGWEGYAFASKFQPVNYSVGFGNPVQLTKNRYIKNPRNTYQLLGALYGEYELLKGLKFRSTINVTLGNSLTTNSLRRAPLDINLQSQYRSLSTYSEYQDNSFQWNWINTLSYAKTVGKHNFSVIIGSDALKNTYRFTNVVTSDVPDAQPVISASDGKTRIVTGYPGEFSLVSYIGRVTYDYAGKYLLTANIRRDGSSKFGPNNKYGTFPSASVGWRISEEPFLKNTPFVDELKLRASYGVVGNQNIPDFKYLTTYNNNGGIYGYTLGADAFVPAIYADNVGDPSIRWERSTQANIGFDASVLKGKFTLTADYYVKRLNDLLGNFPVPSYTGVYGNTILRNGFTMENKGLELALGFNQRVGAVNFSANANFSTVANKITQLTGSENSYVAQSISVGGGAINDGGAQTRTQVGERIGNFYGYVTDGIFQNQGEIDRGGMSGVSPGDRRFKDLNGDGKITADDKQVIGNGLPRYLFGLTLKADYKGFDVSVLLNGQADVQIANMNRFYLYSMRFYNSTGIQNVSSDLLNSWRGEGTSNDLPRNSYNAPTSNRFFSTAYIENGAFVRVRNVQIGYTLPAAWAQKIGSGRARVYVAAQNLHTFTKYTGYDPEIGSPNQNVLTTGTDFGRYPLARMFMGGINVQF